MPFHDHEERFLLNMGLFGYIIGLALIPASLFWGVRYLLLAGVVMFTSVVCCWAAGWRGRSP